VKQSTKNLSLSAKEFSRFAHTYGQYNIIQSKVAKQLVAMLSQQKYEIIIDIGCGCGAVCQALDEKEIHYDRFIALDASEEMLQRHPDDLRIEKILMDFNTPIALKLPKETAVLSSSALQWSKDLDRTFTWLSSLGETACFAIFTSGTFKTLHQTAGIDSPIYSALELKKTLDRYYEAEYYIRHYDLEFESVRDMFRYIKKSGVSGGERQLSYKETKRLMQNYPVNYLEFEVLFMKGIPKKV